MLEKKVSFLGLGNWGSALAQVFADSGFSVLAWTVEESVMKEINSTHTNTRYFPRNIILNPLIKATTNIDEVLNYSNIVIWALPSHIFDNYCPHIQNLWKKNLNTKYFFINLAKGFGDLKHLLMSEYLANKLNLKNVFISSILGAGFAKELINKQPTKLAISSDDDSFAIFIKNNLKTNYFSLSLEKNKKSLELGCSIKNVYALGAGIICGLGYSINTISTYVSSCLKEIKILAKIITGDENSIYSAPILADFILTNTSSLSRNFSAGKQIAENFFLSNKSDVTIEGITALKLINEYIKINKINNLNIIELLFSIILEKRINPEELINYIILDN